VSYLVISKGKKKKKTWKIHSLKICIECERGE